MQVSSALFASVTVFITGCAILWMNPWRKVNRAVAIASFQTGAWLALWHITTTVSVGKGLFWLRWTCCIGALSSLIFYIVKETIVARPALPWPSWIKRHGFFIVVPAYLMALPFSDFFIPHYSTPQLRLHGPGYLIYSYGQLVMIVAVVISAIWDSRSLDRIRKVELNLLVGGSCLMFFFVVTLGLLSESSGNPLYRAFAPITTLILYGAITYALTTYRIVDARQLFLVGFQKAILVTAVTACGVMVYQVSVHFLPSIAAFVVTVLGSWIFATKCDDWLNRVFTFHPESREARQATLLVAHSETQIERLEEEFLNVAKGWGNSSNAVLFSGTAESLRTTAVQEQLSVMALEVLRQIRWATPERLTRERPTAAREKLCEFLTRNSLGVLVLAEGPSIMAVVGVGLQSARRPYTYPQVMQLLELADIMEPPLERAHFLLRTQRAELLSAIGMLGAGLAHEIRNPLASIRSFVSLLPSKHRDTAFCERFVRPISEEVARIEELIVQLREMGGTRRYHFASHPLHDMLRSCTDVLPTGSGLQAVRFVYETTAEPDTAYTDIDALRQIILNLALNAIQAIQATGKAGWVRIGTRRWADEVEITVADNGPGVPRDRRAKLFKPFHSTKSSGFGLGLAICQDILIQLHGTISLDPFVQGEGAVFRVKVPVRPWRDETEQAYLGRIGRTHPAGPSLLGKPVL